MEQKHRNILKTMRMNIVQDVDPVNVIDKLISEGIILDPFHEVLLSEPTKESKIQKILDYLPKRGPNAYLVFKETLRVNYNWIYKAMGDLEENDDSRDWPDAAGQNIPHSYRPSIPSLNVTRKQKMTQLFEGLQNLKPKTYLALHALRGYGKSTLVSETLESNEEFAKKLFEDEIYWIKFGQDRTISENILFHLNMLFHQVRKVDLISEPLNEESLKYSLGYYFYTHYNALLILDDVNSREIIEAFDFGCKTLVLTTNINILNGREFSVINMNDGLTVNESLALFAKALDVRVLDLPIQAEKIHEECKGMPLLIAMLSAQFKDVKESLTQGEKSADTWSYYLKAIQKKHSPVLQESLEEIAAIFDVVINNLPVDEIDYYKTLVIFPEDVNITTKTLSVFWDIDPAEVDARMSDFCKKSLAVRQWHKRFKTYIYGIHHLVLCHLRHKLESELIKEFHKSYVDKNFAACNGDFSKFPKDNYIYSYIGHHMEEAGYTEKFTELYLDFGFIEAKIDHIGPGDLLIDLRKYRTHITQDSANLLEKVMDLAKFLIQQASTLAEYRRRNCLDLIQVALKHPYSGFVKDTAESLANARPNRLYFNHSKQNTQYLNSCSEELYMQVHSIACTNKANLILIGNDDGKVFLWNCDNRSSIPFYGNSDGHSIKKIIMSSEEKYFVTLSEDGKAKLFDLRRVLDTQYGYEYRTLNPRNKQTDWKPMCDNKNNQDDSRFTFSVPNGKIMDIAISSNGKTIAAGTDTGSVSVWNSDGKILTEPFQLTNSLFNSIAFTMGDALLLAVNLETKALIELNALTCKYLMQSRLQPNHVKIIRLISVPRSIKLLVVLCENKLLLIIRTSIQEFHSQPLCKEFATLRDERIVYTCASVSRDGKYVVTADTGGSVNIYNLHEEPKILKTYKKTVTSLDTYMIEEEGIYIICGGNHDNLVSMVHRWKFNPSEKPVIQRLPLFDAITEVDGKNVIAVPTSNGTVQVIQNKDVIAETPAVQSRITKLILFNDGNCIAYGAEDGNFHIFDIKRNDFLDKRKLSKPIHYMTVLKIDDKDVILCASGNDNLQIWKNCDDFQLVETSEPVIFAEVLMSVSFMLTVSNKAIKLWDKTWRLQKKEQPLTVPEISCCCISVEKNLLTVANFRGNLNVFKLVPAKRRNTIEFQKFEERNFNVGITACSFSYDETLLALGFETGVIEIISIKDSEEKYTLNFHRGVVRQLYWSYLNNDDHILMSLCNELAWWDISILSDQRAKEENAKQELSKSFDELTYNLNINGASNPNPENTRLKTSRSLDFENKVTKIKTNNIRDYNDQLYLNESPSSSQNFLSINSSMEEGLESSSNKVNRNKNNNSSLWSGKTSKYSNINGLLSVVKLDGNSATKVCISKNYDTFVTMDDEGSINKLTVLEPNKNDKNYLST